MRFCFLFGSAKKVSYNTWKRYKGPKYIYTFECERRLYVELRITKYVNLAVERVIQERIRRCRAFSKRIEKEIRKWRLEHPGEILIEKDILIDGVSLVSLPSLGD